MIEAHAQYLAGLMDGEGWVECKRKNKKTSNEDHEPGHDEDDDEKKEKTLTGKKKAAVDVNPDLQAQKY